MLRVAGGYNPAAVAPSAPILAPAGTVALPSYSFAVGTSAGMSVSANGLTIQFNGPTSIDFYIGGGGRLDLNNTALIPFADLSYDLGDATHRYRNVMASGYRAAEAANGKQGTAVLVGGTVTVANTSITASSRIFLTSNVDGGAPGFLRVSARVVGTSFTITSSSGTDTSTVAYEIFEPA